MIPSRFRRNLIGKFNTSKTKFNKRLKCMKKREKSVDSEVVGVEKSFTECIKLEASLKWFDRATQYK